MTITPHLINKAAKSKMGELAVSSKNWRTSLYTQISTRITSRVIKIENAMLLNRKSHATITNPLVCLWAKSQRSFFSLKNPITLEMKLSFLLIIAPLPNFFEMLGALFLIFFRFFGVDLLQESLFFRFKHDF